MNETSWFLLTAFDGSARTLEFLSCDYSKARKKWRKHILSLLRGWDLYCDGERLETPADQLSDEMLEKVWEEHMKRSKAIVWLLETVI